MHLGIFSRFKFIYFERERERENQWERIRERGREREGENPKQDPPYQCKARCGARTHKLWNHDLSQNQELDPEPTEPPWCRRNIYFIHFTCHQWPQFIQLCHPHSYWLYPLHHLCVGHATFLANVLAVNLKQGSFGKAFAELYTFFPAFAFRLCSSHLAKWWKKDGLVTAGSIAS